MNEMNVFQAIIKSGIKSSFFIKDYVKLNQKIQIFLKAGNQKYTNVDVISQHLLETNILSFNPNINLVCEENVKDEERKSILHDLSYDYRKYLLKKDNFDYVQLNNFISNIYHNSKLHNNTLDVKDLQILIDPIDGTNSFITKDYKSATILIGALYKGYPIFGFVGCPFYTYAADKITLFFNLPKLGVFKIVIDKEEHLLEIKFIHHLKPKKNDKIKLITSYFKIDAVKEKFKTLKKYNFDIRTMNSMGFRTLKIIEDNFNFISLNSEMGYWDICASDAICRELGGGCFQTENGNLLDYQTDLRKKVGRDFLLGNNATILKKFILENQKLIKSI